MLTAFITTPPPSVLPPGATLVLGIGLEWVAAIVLAALALTAGLLLDRALLAARPSRGAVRLLRFPADPAARRAA